MYYLLPYTTWSTHFSARHFWACSVQTVGIWISFGDCNEFTLCADELTGVLAVGVMTPEDGPGEEVRSSLLVSKLQWSPVHDYTKYNKALIAWGYSYLCFHAVYMSQYFLYDSCSINKLHNVISCKWKKFCPINKVVYIKQDMYNTYNWPINAWQNRSGIPSSFFK